MRMKLYMVQSKGDTFYVIAKNYNDAIGYWESNYSEKIEPDHVALVADDSHLLGI